MGKLTIDEVKHISKLSNLDLTDKELIKFQGQLSKIVDYISQLSEVDTANIEPTSQTTGLENIYRPDEVKPNSFSQEEALSGTEQIKNGYFEVDAVLNKES